MHFWEQQIIICKIAGNFWEERIITRKCGTNYHVNYRLKSHAEWNNRRRKNAGKFPRNIVSSEISLKSQEKPGISSKFTCVTFAQHCTCRSGKFRLKCVGPMQPPPKFGTCKVFDNCLLAKNWK